MENSRALPPDDIVHFWNLDTQAPQAGPSFLGVQKERPILSRSLTKESKMVPRAEIIKLSPLCLSLSWLLDVLPLIVMAQW